MQLSRERERERERERHTHTHTHRDRDRERQRDGEGEGGGGLSASVLKQDSNVYKIKKERWFKTTIQNVRMCRVSQFFQPRKQQVNGDQSKCTYPASVVVCSEWLGDCSSKIKPDNKLRLTRSLSYSGSNLPENSHSLLARKFIQPVGLKLNTAGWP